MTSSAGRQVEMLGDEFAQLAGHRGAALHVDDRTAPAALEQRLEQQHEVFGFFLDFDVAVAQDAEHARHQSHAMTGEQPVEVQLDHVFQRNEAHGLVLIRQTHEALQLRRHRQKRRDRLAVALRINRNASVKPRLGMNGNGCAGIDGKRRQNRKNLLAEFLFEPVAISRRQFRRFEHRRHRPRAIRHAAATHMVC